MFGINFEQLIYILPGIIIAITFHEAAHAWVAIWCGDETPRAQGRNTLNPIKHIEPVGFILLMVAHFGWGKPVQINPLNFKKQGRDTMLVSIAGPVMNFVLAIVIAVIQAVLLKTGALDGFEYADVVNKILLSAVSINVALGVFNLIPLPPLDGSKILAYFLPYSARQWFENNERIFYYAFLGLWITGISSFIISPIIDGIFYGLYNLIFTLFGL